MTYKEAIFHAIQECYEKNCLYTNEDNQKNIDEAKELVKQYFESIESSIEVFEMKYSDFPLKEYQDKLTILNKLLNLEVKK